MPKIKIELRSVRDQFKLLIYTNQSTSHKYSALELAVMHAIGLAVLNAFPTLSRILCLSYNIVGNTHQSFILLT
jgi:hypothetical protein